MVNNWVLRNLVLDFFGGEKNHDPMLYRARTSGGSTTDGQYQTELDRSMLPNEITAKLPATNEYLIKVCKPLLVAKKGIYSVNTVSLLKPPQELIRYLHHIFVGIDN